MRVRFEAKVTRGFFPLSLLDGSRLSLFREEKFQEKPLGPGYDFTDKATFNVANEPGGDVALKDSEPAL